MIRNFIIRNFVIFWNFVTKYVSSLTVSFYFVYCINTVYTGKFDCTPLLGKFFILMPAD
jgi:hypothetical protein